MAHSRCSPACSATSCTSWAVWRRWSGAPWSAEGTMEAVLALEDGRIFRGRSIGAAGERTGEVVFNTSMVGYQEVLTDPSYRGQIVAMTYPLVGNYGVNADDAESQRVQVEGFIVRELTRLPSNFRSQGGLADYLAAHNVIGL